MDHVLENMILTELLPHGVTGDKEGSNSDHMYYLYINVYANVLYGLSLQDVQWDSVYIILRLE